MIARRVFKGKNRGKGLAGRLCLQVFMVVIAAAVLLPVFTVVNFSLKTKKELYVDSPLDIPHALYLDNYENALDRLKVGTTFVNTSLYTALSTFSLALLSGAAAWAIARNRVPSFDSPTCIFCWESSSLSRLSSSPSISWVSPSI